MSIDERMLAFVAWHGGIPRDAVRIEDYDARSHASRWVRHNLGKGIVHSYVIGYARGDTWWTLFFERISTSEPKLPEPWWIEAYGNDGKGWRDTYLYWPEEKRWRHAMYLQDGDDYGRHGIPEGDRAAR